MDTAALGKGRSRATLPCGFSPRTGPPFAGSHHRLAMTEGGGVIAPQRAHLRQSVSPQKSLASWPYFGQIRSPFRIRPKYYSPLCPAARRTDCHVASLLAMTVGEVLAPVDTPCLLHTLRAPRPCTRAHVPAFCMSLRTSAHTGVAIRVPAEMPGKLALLRANSQPLSYSPKVLLSAMPCRKENGLPRRFAPNTRSSVEDARQRLQGGTAGVLPESVLATADMPPSSAHPSRQTPLQPLTPARLQHVIANQCAHWCGNPFPRRKAWQAGPTSGKSAAPFVFAQSTTLRYALPQGVRIATSLRSSQ